MTLKKFLPLLVSAAFFVPAQIQAAPMTLSVHDADLRATITLIGKNGGINVLADDSVKGNVSISVQNVDPVRILEIIANIKNLRLLHEAGVYVLTAELVPAEPMQSYVLPIKYGDADILRKAVYKVLDIEPEKPHVESMKVKDSEGNERTYKYTFDTPNHTFSGDDEKDDPRTKRVFINPEVNALILFGTPAEYERVKNLLATLDVELKQVSVEAKILAITKEDAKNLGVEWSWSSLDGTYSAQRGRSRSSESSREYYDSSQSSNRYSNESSRNRSSQSGQNHSTSENNSFKEGYPNAEDNGNRYSYEEEDSTYRGNTNQFSGANVFNGSNLIQNIFSGSSLIQFGRSLTSVTGLNWALSAQINALVTNGKAKILSRPNVTTIQGREAVINVGNSVPVPKISSTNTATTTEIEYRDAGIILRYTPRINDDGTITATIHTEVSTPQYVAEMQAYRFNTRSAETTVTVRDGEPMIIGGLIGAEETKSVSKIPFLGDLPILGALFRNHRNSKSESELMIFLTAHVIR